MSNLATAEIEVQDLDHSGIVAGICDQIELVEQINKHLGTHPQELISSGQVIKAMLLNGLGFVSAPLYLAEKFWEGKATEHLLGVGIKPEHLNDDRLGRVLDKLYSFGLTELFVTIALSAARKFGVEMNSFHLDSSSFHVDGDYAQQTDESSEPSEIHITYGYSRDHRPDLKQFIVDLMCSGDGDIPLYLRVGDGNETDSAMFAQLVREFQQQWQIEALFVADAALYTKDNLVQMAQLRWVSRVPATLTAAKQLLQDIDRTAFVDSVPGYKIAACGNSYALINQRWLVVESQARQTSDLEQLERRIAKQLTIATAALKHLANQHFACEPDALTAAMTFERSLPYHQLRDLSTITLVQHKSPGRPRKETVGETHYQISAVLMPNQTTIDLEIHRAGRFILATNDLDEQVLSNDHVLSEYKAQQSTERGFRFLKDPLFFTSSVFLNSPNRVAAMAMVMGLCLLVYSLGQRSLRKSLATAEETIPNQVGKPTTKPTLRWIFQCFMSIHLLTIEGIHHVTNLTTQRLWILQFFGAPIRKYYLLS